MYDIHQADVAATETETPMSRKAWCRELGRMVGTINDRVEVIPASVLGNLADHPATWETQLRWLASDIASHHIIKHIAADLRRHTDSAPSVAVADEQAEFWLGYYSVANEGWRAECGAIFAAMGTVAPFEVGVDVARPMRAN